MNPIYDFLSLWNCARIWGISQRFGHSIIPSIEVHIGPLAEIKFRALGLLQGADIDAEYVHSFAFMLNIPFATNVSAALATKLAMRG